MRLSEIELPASGLYVSVKYTAETEARLSAYAREHKIPNPVSAKKYHTTVVYSRAPIYWRAQEELGTTVEAVAWEVWQDHEDKPILVLRVDSPYLRERFKTAMDRGASYDYPDFNPHITFSYYVGEFDAAKLPLPDFALELDKEIAEPLADK